MYPWKVKSSQKLLVLQNTTLIDAISAVLLQQCYNAVVGYRLAWIGLSSVDSLFDLQKGKQRILGVF